MGLYEIGKDKKGRPIKAYFDGRRVNEDIDAFYTSFANLVEKYGYEEIVGHLESMKMAYMLLCWDKAKAQRKN